MRPNGVGATSYTMNAAEPSFVDTNVLIYSIDEANPAKQRAARAALRVLWESGSGRLSWQVLNEFYYNATRKIGAPAKAVRNVVQLYSVWQRAEFDFSTVRRAWHWVDQANLGYWDALILASAESSECRWLLSEDFQDGRRYGSIQVVNPFSNAEIFSTSPKLHAP